MQVALSAKLAAGDVLVVSDLTIGDAKTRQLEKVLGQLGVKGSALIVTSLAGADALVRAARNLSGVKVASPDQVNVYDVLKHQSLVIAQPALARLREVWA